MLASTVQFSTNDQPTTHHENTRTSTNKPAGNKPTQRLQRTGMFSKLCLAVPKKQPPDSHPDRLFFQDPTGAFPSAPAAPGNLVPTITDTPHKGDGLRLY